MYLEQFYGVHFINFQLLFHIFMPVSFYLFLFFKWWQEFYMSECRKKKKNNIIYLHIQISLCLDGNTNYIQLKMSKQYLTFLSV